MDDTFVADIFIADMFAVDKFIANTFVADFYSPALLVEDSHVTGRTFFIISVLQGLPIG